MTGKVKYFLAGIIPYIIWGSMSIPLRNIKHFPSQEILYYRVLASVVIVWSVIFLFRRAKLVQDYSFLRSLSRTARSRFILLSVSAALLITGNWFSYIYAVNHVSLKAAAFAYMVCPLITALCGFLILKETLSKLKILALVLALFSIVLLATGSLVEVGWAILIASFYALYLILLKVIQGVDKFNFLGLQLILSALLMLPFYFHQAAPFPADVYFWSNILIISVLFTIIPLFLNAYALLGMPSSALGILIYLNPIVAFAVAFFYFKEEIDVHQVFAYLLLFTSIVIFNVELLKRVTYKKI